MTYTQNLINRIIAHVENFANKEDLSSIVLTGSLGREEGTFHIDTKTKELVLDSDVELALVYKYGKKDSAEKIKQSLINCFAEDMNPMTISESRVRNAYNFNYSVKTPRYSSIFMYDFYHGSKTIWGKDFLQQKAVQYDKYEAKRIVANRIGELVCVKQSTFNENDIRIKQWEGKLLLAIGSAYCILNNSYQSKYEAQYHYISNEKDKLTEFLGETFVDDYKMAFQFLRKGSDVYTVPSERLPQYVSKINKILEQEAKLNPQINSTSRMLKYVISCVKSKTKMNPFTCETTIINTLISSFINSDNNLSETSESWKKILY